MSHQQEKHPPEFLPRVLAVEVTRRCNLSCIHCRASASEAAPEGELTLPEYQKLFDDVAAFASPLIILTGGEPLLRPDLYVIAAYATGRGLRVAVSTNGTLVTKDAARELLAAGVQTCSISIDGSSPEVHDDFRQQPGAFEASLRGMRILQEAGIKVQVNTSLTKRNFADLDNIYRLVKKLNAHSWHVFMLVPTGRGGEVADRELIDADDYERTLNYLYEKNRDDNMEIKPTCAPQYYRILRQRAAAEGIPVDVEHFGVNARTRGCLAGLGFGFVSYRGEVFPCGYYPVSAGNVRERSFREIWDSSPLFLKLRDFRNYQGVCGSCGYLRVCGGCRARAYAVTGDDLAAEPYCRHGEAMTAKPPELDELDRKILNRIQEGVPLEPRPFRALGPEFGLSEDELLARVQRLGDAGVVRRLGPILNYPAWDMSGVLVAAQVKPERVPDAEAAMREFPEITHAYLRDHEWNLWFTVIAQDEAARNAVIAEVTRRAELTEVRKLPQLKSFKLGVRFEA